VVEYISQLLVAAILTTEGTEDTENGKKELWMKETKLSVAGLVSTITGFQPGLLPL